MKIAVVGTGIIGIEHLKAIKLSKTLELSAVCDINEEKGRAIADEYGVPFFKDYKDIPANTDSEAVIINLPHALHCESTVFFLESGLHVLLEKPMANTTEECELMKKAERESGKRLAIGHVQRFIGANRTVKEYIKSGKIGRLFAVTELRSIDYFAPSRPAWFINKKLAGGGIIMNYGAHALDKLAYMTDGQVEQISGFCGNLLENMEVEGHAQFVVKMSGGVTATVTFSGYGGVGYENVYIGTKGAIKVNKSHISVCEGGVWQSLTQDKDGTYMLRQLDEFVKFVNGEENEMPDSEYGSAIIAAIEELYSKN